MVVVVWAVGLALPACRTPAPPYDYSKEPDPRRQEFVIGPSDVLRISVWRNPDLSTEATVRPDGTITLPLVGDVMADGRTPGQVRAEIAQRLGGFIKDEAATVAVAVTGVNSYRFTVSGNVEKGGLFTSKHFVTVMEAIAMAGGPTRFASADQTLIVRPERGGKTRRIPVNYTAVSTGQRPEQNLVLLAGDTVFVP